MDYLYLYLLGLADTFIALKVLITIIFSIFAIGMAVDWYGERNKSYFEEEFGKSKKVTIILGIVTALVLAVPTKESLILMGGLHYGKKVVTNERIEKVNKIIDLELDHKVQELLEGVEGK